LKFILNELYKHKQHGKNLNAKVFYIDLKLDLIHHDVCSNQLFPDVTELQENGTTHQHTQISEAAQQSFTAEYDKQEQ